MNKHILNLMLCFIGILVVSCNNESEEYLLSPKVYFEKNEFTLEVEDQNTITYDLQARLSKMYSSPVEVSYALADSSEVIAYNKRHGTEYVSFDMSNAKLSSDKATVPEGEIYTNKTRLELKNLDKIEEGKPCLLPVRITSSTLPAIASTDVVYIIISKPIRIMKVGRFYSNSIKVPVTASKKFKSVTYEALIYMNSLGSNNTIMGTEGILILRIGDTALPGGHNDWIQIAGEKQYHSTQTFTTGRWYHVAFTYDQPTGKTAIYIDGKKATESTWDTPEFDLSNGGFFIGKVDGFMWGERPFYGYMSEVRLWNVSRTENQIQQNMLNVDPKSDGLAAYYKLNGTDQYQADDGKWYVKDASGHNMDGLVNRGNSSLRIIELDNPVVIK